MHARVASTEYQTNSTFRSPAASPQENLNSSPSIRALKMKNARLLSESTGKTRRVERISTGALNSKFKLFREELAIENEE